jgi:hypothetical protein
VPPDATKPVSGTNRDEGAERPPLLVENLLDILEERKKKVGMLPVSIFTKVNMFLWLCRNIQLYFAAAQNSAE